MGSARQKHISDLRSRATELTKRVDHLRAEARLSKETSSEAYRSEIERLMEELSSVEDQIKMLEEEGGARVGKEERAEMGKAGQVRSKFGRRAGVGPTSFG